MGHTDQGQAAAVEDVTPGPDAGFGALLLDVAPRIMRLETTRLARLDTPLTHRQYRTLLRISLGMTSPTRISRAANISLAAISESVEALTRRGLITRSNDEHDRRASRLGLTAAGEEALAAALRSLDALADEIAAGISQRLQDAGRDALTTVYANVLADFTRRDDAAGSRRG